MAYIHTPSRHMTTLGAFLIVGALCGALVLYQAVHVTRAHQTLAGYAAFRGCVHLSQESDIRALCSLPTGDTITLVSVHGKWYLDGDLPSCWGSMCW